MAEDSEGEARPPRDVTSDDAPPSPLTAICAIGASAGGLAPVEAFFSAMSPSTGVGFVVVPHLSPDHESMMVPLVARHTDMKVQEAVDGMRIEPNSVYLIPPGGALSVSDGMLHVTDRALGRGTVHLPIDAFFSSMAEAYGEAAIAVVLSGTGSDGTAGIEKVAAAGGLALVQDSSASFAGMPDAASRTGIVDSVLAPEELAEAVATYAISRGRPSSRGESRTLNVAQEQILNVVESRSGVGFSHYKVGTLSRRLERRLVRNEIDEIGYLNRLKNDPVESEHLVRDLLVDVTSFFRDPEMFEIFERQVVPGLIADAAERDTPIRVWVAGCSSGQEAYSYAMTLNDAIARSDQPTVRVQIFATDVHAGSIEFASQGIYSEEQLDGLPQSRLDQYFDKVPAGWKVSSDLRSLVTFAQHDILFDAPFTRMDLVSCRNVMIYFKRAAQTRALGSLTFALKLGGSLILGSSESLGVAEPDFLVVDPGWRIFTKSGDSMRRSFRPARPKSRRSMTAGVSGFPVDQKLLRAYDAILASQFASGLLINENRELVHTFGEASQWMRPPQGRPTLNALAMISDGRLRLALASSLRELLESGESADRIVQVPDAEGLVRRSTLVGCRIVTGDDYHYLLHTRPVESGVVAGPVVSHDSGSRPDVDLEFIEELESELAYTRESLQAALEEQETSNEELNASNEELVASNEELQSTNEELSSVNEELRTLNDEHRRRLEHVLDLSADLEQLMSSTEIGVVFLAEDQSIRRFNEPARRFFRVRDSDIGRPFQDITSMLDIPQLEADISHTYWSGDGSTRQVALRNGTPGEFLIQVNRYNLPRSRWGVFVAVVDLGDSAVTPTDQLLSAMVKQLPGLVGVADSNGNIMYVTPGMGEALRTRLDRAGAADSADSADSTDSAPAETYAFEHLGESYVGVIAAMTDEISLAPERSVAHDKNVDLTDPSVTKELP